MFTHAYAVANARLPQAPCVRTNNTFDTLNPLLNKLEGAFGGLLFTLGPVMFVILVVLGLVTAMTNRGTWFFKIAIVVLLVPFGAITVMALVNGLMNGANGSC